MESQIQKGEEGVPKSADDNLNDIGEIGANAEPATTSARLNRFGRSDSNERKPARMSLREKRVANKLRSEAIRESTKPTNILKGDYKTRGLDYCYFCGEKFNVGEKIPRILIHCGHTFCTECLNVLHND